MTAQEFRTLCAATGLSVRDLAALLGMRGRNADVHIREMLDGVRPVPGPTGVAVRALADGWRPGAWPEAETVTALLHRYELAVADLSLDGEANGVFPRAAAMLRRLTGRGDG